MLLFGLGVGLGVLCFRGLLVGSRVGFGLSYTTTVLSVGLEVGLGVLCFRGLLVGSLVGFGLSYTTTDCPDGAARSGDDGLWNTVFDVGFVVGYCVGYFVRGVIPGEF